VAATPFDQPALRPAEKEGRRARGGSGGGRQAPQGPRPVPWPVLAAVPRDRMAARPGSRCVVVPAQLGCLRRAVPGLVPARPRAHAASF